MVGKHFRVSWGFPKPFDEIEHLTRDIEPELVGLPLASVSCFDTPPALFCRDIDEVQLNRQAGSFREISKFGAALRLAEAEVQHAGNVPRRDLQRHRPYLRQATFDALNRPRRVEWLRGIHPEQRSHPFIDRESNTLQTIAEPQRIGCLAGSRRAADEVDQVMLHTAMLPDPNQILPTGSV